MRIRYVILLVVASMATTYWWAVSGERANRRFELEEAKLVREIYPCVPPTVEEQQMFAMAVDMLDRNKITEALAIDIGLEQFLAHGFYRRVASDLAMRVCPPEGMYSRVGKILTDRNGLNGFIERYQLDLAARIPDPSPYIVDKVAEVAFASEPHVERQLLYKDLRPLARSVLANYGKRAKKYLLQARAQMSDDDSLGTGAAQIAGAAGDASDLDEVEAIMSRRLAVIPLDRAVSLHERYRLYELAYTFIYVGPAAARNVAPVRELMKRKVQHHATMFGLIDLDPGEMCYVLDAVGDDAVADFDYCLEQVRWYKRRSGHSIYRNTLSERD